MPEVFATAAAWESVSAAEGAFMLAYRLSRRLGSLMPGAARSRVRLVKRCMNAIDKF